ncbi:pyruvate kinase [Lachnospiraceae bacterium YH-ros2226]
MKDNYRRKTKIICTLGPASDSEEKMEELIKSGMNIARFNFSHGDHEEQEGRLNRLKKVRERLGAPIAAMLDTKGPEIRLKTFKDGAVDLEEGQKFTLTAREVEGTSSIVSISYKELPRDVKADDHILIDDGLIELVIDNVVGDDINCTVLNGGHVSDKKGVNVPNVDLSMPYISPKDRSDLVFGCEQGFDFISASFTRTANDINDIRQVLSEHGGQNIKIIAKIENNQGINNIDSIIDAADGIMVARGDMGVEIPMEEVPSLQKMIIKKTYMKGKVVITATQMLDSMIHHPRPTRAEVTDVANAVYDGTSAIMLSGESAMGDYPVEAVRAMDRIARRTEQDINYLNRQHRYERSEHQTVTDAVSHSACLMAGDLSAAAILTVTMSGRTARMVAKYRPLSPIIAGCTEEQVWRQLNMNWGVTPVLIEKQDDENELFQVAIRRAKEERLVQAGDIVIVTAGVPLGVSGTTNVIREMTVR